MNKHFVNKLAFPKENLVSRAVSRRGLPNNLLKAWNHTTDICVWNPGDSEAPDAQKCPCHSILFVVRAVDPVVTKGQSS